jgi:subfamily B ATP-binding cassette protein MsbA
MTAFPRLLRFLRRYTLRLAVGVLAMAVFSSLNGVSLGMIVPMVNLLFFRDQVPAGDLAVEVSGGVRGIWEAALAFIQAGTPLESLTRLCVIVLVLFLLKNVFWYLHSFILSTVQEGVVRDLRNLIYAHLQEMSLSFFHSARVGDLVSRIIHDVGQVRASVGALVLELLRETSLLIVYIVIAVLASWKLFLLSLVVLPPIAFAAQRLSGKLRKRSKKAQEKMADVATIVQETFWGARVVKAFAMEPFEYARFSKGTQSHYRARIRLRTLSLLAAPISELLAVTGAVVVLWIGVRLVLSGRGMDAAGFLVFLAAVLSMMHPVKRLSTISARISQGLGAADRIFAVLDTKPEIAEKPDAVECPPLSHGLQVAGVSFSYGESEVLKNVDLTIRAGEVVAAVGPSGAGKSTLADLLVRFYDPSDGIITIDGLDLRDITVSSLRRIMGVVTQETILFNDTVARNIAYGEEELDMERIVAAARAANAHGFIEEMERGYDTVLREKGSRLSGGQRQRIAIARAIMKNPRLLIFDEATSSLDSQSEALVQEAIDRLMKGRTTFVIAHRLSTVMHADRIIVMDEGRILQEGTHESLMKESGLYRRLYELQFRDAPSGDESATPPSHHS